MIITHNRLFNESQPAHLVLLLPDSADQSSAKVSVWLDAIKEEGFPVKIMRDSEFLRPWTNRTQISGVILPDQVHRVASDSLISTLKSYVEHGGNLMLVYDAGVWSPERRYISTYSRFSELAGINYAFYNKLKEKTISWQPVIASDKTFSELRIPPGKYSLYSDLSVHAKGSYPAIDANIIDPEMKYSISDYGSALVSYNVYKTHGKYNGKILLQSPLGDIIAGQRQIGTGTVLFINLPLGYLKGRTDGLFLHNFLHYFANTIVNLPYLSSAPDGVGGIIMNWHLDSNVTLQPLKKITELGIYEQGPYSIHITAGPHAHFKGDWNGVNVPKNKRIQKFIRFFKEKGYQVGSHGGWIHDRFGDHVTKEPSEEFIDYLVKNKHALEKVKGTPVTEYSAPKGNHPEWVTGWLIKNGITSYYFTGNTGMAPTRSYRNGVLKYPSAWSFPILPYKDMAGFEELVTYKVNPQSVKKWLVDATDFTADNSNIRLIYFHPRGALFYKTAMRAWLNRAKILQDKGRFRWYTMTGIASFLSRRIQTEWDFSVSGQDYHFMASHPDNLEHQAWLLAIEDYDKPEVTEGHAKIRKINDQWAVIAGNGKKLAFNSKRLK
ncbi:MAG: hypothetical protein P8Y24_06120 [Gammaproteobacteria bacterium]